MHGAHHVEESWNPRCECQVDDVDIGRDRKSGVDDQKLVGAKVGQGWRKAVTEAVGRTKGCTHITELLMPAATVAFQTMGNWKSAPSSDGQKPHFIDGCHAWSSDGPVVKKLFPMHFRETAGGETMAASQLRKD